MLKRYNGRERALKTREKTKKEYRGKKVLV